MNFLGFRLMPSIEPGPTGLGPRPVPALLNLLKLLPILVDISSLGGGGNASDGENEWK